MGSIGAKLKASDIANLLSNDIADVQIEACRALGQLGARSEEQLFTLLAAPQPHVRAAACSALGLIAKQNGGGSEVGDRIGSLLTDSSPVVREAALHAAGSMAEEAC